MANPAPHRAMIASSSTRVAATPLRACSRTLKLLADETRLAVIELLLSGPRHVHKINACLHMEATLLSHHLRVLREAGLVCAVRQGKSILYRIAPGIRPAHRSRAVDFGCCVVSFRPRSKCPRKACR